MSTFFAELNPKLTNSNYGLKSQLRMQKLVILYEIIFLF